MKITLNAVNIYNYNINTSHMFVLKKVTFLFILISFFLNNCTILPGINKSPNKKKP